MDVYVLVCPQHNLTFCLSVSVEKDTCVELPVCKHATEVVCALSQEQMHRFSSKLHNVMSDFDKN